GRAAMKEISITLASREDGEAVARIEKLIGHKIPRAGDKLAEEPAAAERPAKPEKQAKAEKPARRAPASQKREKSAEPKPAQPAERSPVVEDLKGEWNGPLPGFLSVSAG